MDHRSTDVFIHAGKRLDFPRLLPLTCPQDTPSLAKYWSQRYRLFSRFNNGIHLDSGKGETEMCICMSEIGVICIQKIDLGGGGLGL